MSKAYKIPQHYDQKVEWKDLIYDNNAKPRSCFITWLACHGKLATKDRLFNFGMIDNKKCCFCSEEESKNHIFFAYQTTRSIWIEVLN